MNNRKEALNQLNTIIKDYIEYINNIKSECQNNGHEFNNWEFKANVYNYYWDEKKGQIVYQTKKEWHSTCDRCGNKYIINDTHYKNPTIYDKIKRKVIHK